MLFAQDSIMAAIADTLDFFGSFFDKRPASKGKKLDSLPIFSTVYLAFALLVLVVAEAVELTFSTVLTVGAGLQSLAFVLLCAHVRRQRSVAGLSARSLELAAAALALRLLSTSLKNGYIPVDATGDGVYQLLDLLSLAGALDLLYRMSKTYRETHTEDADPSGSAARTVAWCMLGGFLVHGNFNKSPFFDALWSASLNVETVMMVPQIRLLLTAKEKVDGLTAHFVPLYALGVVARFVFWWYACTEFGKPLPAWHVLGMHTAQLLSCGVLLFAYAQPRMQADRGDAADIRSSEPERNNACQSPASAPGTPGSQSSGLQQECLDFDEMPCSWR